MSLTVGRRQFLEQLGRSGAALAAGSWLASMGYVAAAGPARAIVNQARVRSELDRRLFGSFLEHLGRAVYTGVFEPGSPLADAKGFRRDVAERSRAWACRSCGIPGGNFVSGYNWLDGVGPKGGAADRPGARVELARDQPVRHERVHRVVRVVGTEPLLAFNLGTGTPETAIAYVEYCNVGKGTKWSELRRSHGYDRPHGVRTWCLGNEMDGPWQMGTMPARDYGRKARDTARQMRVLDRTYELIACGSSNTILPTYLVWDREVLEECYDQVDALSLHNYYGNTPALTGNSTARYLAMNLDMERQILEIAAVCDYVQGIASRPRDSGCRSTNGTSGTARAAATSPTASARAPKLLEEVYNLEDALLVGGFLNTLLRRSDRVRIGCLAQIVNVIAPLVTNERGVLRQSIFHPYAWALQ